MSDMDIMCLENAADLCSFYEECDIEEREAILNRFADETEIMAERMATLNALVKHLKTGDHQHLDEDEVAALKAKILNLVDTEVSSEGLSPWRSTTVNDIVRLNMVLHQVQRYNTTIQQFVLE